MKAVVFNEQTVAPIMVKDWAIPEPTQGEVLIQLKAAALNHRDLNITNPNNKVRWVYGSDGAGIVVMVGEGVDGIQVGDEVIINSMVTCMECPACLSGDHANCLNHRIVGGLTWNGTFAEYTKVPARNIVKKPQHLSFTQAAALPMAMGTAWRALVTQGKLTEGQTVLIQGIGGGVALACLQIAVEMGAKVIVTSGSREKLEKALQLGAAAAIHYKEEDVAERVQQLTDGLGAHLVVASTGDVVSTSIKAVRQGGRILQFAYVGKPLDAIDVDTIMAKQSSFIGTAMHSYQEFDDVIKFINYNKIVPVVSEVFPIEEYEQAFDSMKSSRQFGKIVVTI